VPKAQLAHTIVAPRSTVRGIVVALETDGEIQVFDVWESQEAFEAFGVTLLPILAAAGVEMNEPMVARVHNEIKG
jgi:hypothetical protein